MKNKTIVITGGSSGIGYHIAKELCSDNTVILLARDENALLKSSERLQCEYAVCDISSVDSVTNVINMIGEKYHRIDVLVNNAGIWLEKSLEDSSFDEMRNVIEINLLGQMFVSKAVLPLLKKSERSLIVNTNSRAGKMVRKNLSAYNASKWGLEGFSGALRDELESDGIAVINVYPAFTDTDLFDSAGSSRDQSNYLDPKILAELVAKNVELYFDTGTCVTELSLQQMKYFG